MTGVPESLAYRRFSSKIQSCKVGQRTVELSFGKTDQVGRQQETGGGGEEGQGGFKVRVRGGLTGRTLKLRFIARHATGQRRRRSSSPALAKRFGVSRQSMQFRLQNLGILDFGGLLS